jgi:aspartokinase/homoserine dehydrogenase 1
MAVSDIIYREIRLEFSIFSYLCREILFYIEMKVLKFGGTSVGSVESILSVKRIVESESEQVVVVVSALGGITDQLLKTSTMAMAGDKTYGDMFQDMVSRHVNLINAVITDEAKRKPLLEEVTALLDELKSIYQGVFLIRDLSPKTEATIVSYGERISSRIVANLVSGAEWKDSREFIKTMKQNGRNVLAQDRTVELVKEAFKTLPKLNVVGGFISSDAESGEVTNLGRGGSDYTASIIAAALDAEILEIWTDVDGFMTADPKVISTAYVIPELSYVEAMELCNFGAKVVYPPTIYPVCRKNIPILIKNTFNPGAAGTIVKQTVKMDEHKSIKGISSIKGTSLITVSGLSMVGVIGVNQRIFTSLAQHGISVFMVSQASSENSTSIGVQDSDTDKACRVLNEEFQKEIEDGRMFRMKAERGLATVAIVGENMKHTPGIAGKLFGTLGRSGISVIACAQGASETNISFVIQEDSLRKALNSIHDSFFLSEYQVLNLFICGVGTVGGQLLEQIRLQQEKLKKEEGLFLNVVGVASGHNAIFDRGGVELTENMRERLKSAPASDIQRLHDEVIGMNIFNSVFVDCTASAEVAGLYGDFLEHNINVVAANKIAASSDYDNYRRLKQVAQKRGVKFLFETNVGAGLPIIRTINDLRHSGDKILKIEAVLSGTLNFIFNKISADIPFSKTVEMAKAEGYSEPDPRIDLSGKDVIRKLVILTREAGYEINQEDVEANLFIPKSFFEGSMEDFWKNLPTLDADFETRRRRLEREHKVWRFVARYENGKGSVSLEEFEQDHSFYVLEGSNNIVLLTTERYREYPMLIQGYGAGASVTAAGVFADIMSLA